jgi:ATP-dependent Lon protease
LNDKGDLYVDLEGLFRAKLLTVEPNIISIPIQSHSTSIPVSSPTPTLLYFISGVSLRDSSANDLDPRILSLASNFKTLCHDLVKALSSMMNSQITKPITMLLKDCEDNRDVLSQLVDLLAFIVETSWDQSLIVLSTPDLSERLEIVTLLVDRQVKAFQVSIEIDTKVQKKMISQQKEALLQEKVFY